VKKLYIGLAVVAACLFFTHKAQSQSQIFARAAKETFMIVHPENPGTGGTGFVLNTHGKQYTVTNAHVCSLSPNNSMLAIRGAKKVMLQIISVNKEDDLCLLTPVPNQRGLSLGRTIEQYEEVYVVGYPLLMPISARAGWVRGRGIFGINYCESMRTANYLPNFVRMDNADFIEQLLGRDCVRPMSAIITNADIKPGNSGSPILDDNSKVVGVAFAGDDQGTSLIVPLERLQKYLEQF
jgi:S1-C subfamily serine protease